MIWSWLEWKPWTPICPVPFVMLSRHSALLVGTHICTFAHQRRRVRSYTVLLTISKPVHCAGVRHVQDSARSLEAINPVLQIPHPPDTTCTSCESTQDKHCLPYDYTNDLTDQRGLKQPTVSTASHATVQPPTNHHTTYPHTAQPTPEGCTTSSTKRTIDDIRTNHSSQPARSHPHIKDHIPVQQSCTGPCTAAAPTTQVCVSQLD